MCRRAATMSAHWPRHPDLIAGPLAEPVIAVDAMGGDYAPDEIVAGALAAQREHGLTTLLTGPPARLRPVIARLGAGSELRVVPAEDVVRMDEGALAGFRRPRSSLAIACQLVRRGQASAVVSAGSTGAIVASAQAPAAPAAGRAPARPGGRAADPPHPDGAHRRGRDGRPQAGDARPVRPAGRGLRADRARHRRPPGRAAHHRRRARQGKRADPPRPRAARGRARSAARCRCTSRATWRAAT